MPEEKYQVDVSRKIFEAHDEPKQTCPICKQVVTDLPDKNHVFVGWITRLLQKDNELIRHRRFRCKAKCVEN